MADKLAMSRYWALPLSPQIKVIVDRLDTAYQNADPGPADLGPRIDTEEVVQRVRERRKKTALPYRQELEAEFGTDLSWLRSRMGESEAMRLVEEDWLVVGQTLVFGAERPSYTEVKTAVGQVLERKKVTR